MVGLSILSGSHVTLTKRTIDALREAGGDDKIVVVGGTIPTADVPKLRDLGVADVFPTGTSVEELVERVGALVPA